MTTKCPHRQQRFKDGHRFCKVCGADLGEAIPFDPDYVVATASVLSEWLETRNMTTRILAAGCAAKERRDEVTAMFDAVLNKAPLTDEAAQLLSIGTGISVEFWLAFEHNYRTGLAVGKKES